MSTSEQLAKSIKLDNRGIHVLLWDNKDDLVRVVIVLMASLDINSIEFLLLSSVDQSVKELKGLLELQPSSEKSMILESDSYGMQRESFLILFLQQATSRALGPWLNGWRSSLAKPPGALLIIRNADFVDFQRYTPDLSSFIGPKIYDSSSMLSMWSRETDKKINPRIPKKIKDILQELPGALPTIKEIENWIRHHPPIDP